MTDHERRLKIFDMKLNQINWKQREINNIRRRGLKYVNFTCLQTLDEAQADLNEEYDKLKKEITAYNATQ